MAYPIGTNPSTYAHMVLMQRANNVRDEGLAMAIRERCTCFGCNCRRADEAQRVDFEARALAEHTERRARDGRPRAGA